MRVLSSSILTGPGVPRRHRGLPAVQRAAMLVFCVGVAAVAVRLVFGCHLHLWQCLTTMSLCNTSSVVPNESEACSIGALL